MKRSTQLHAVMIIAGIAGFLALVGAWIAGPEGMFLGRTETHLFWDALNLQIIAVSAGICTLIYMKRERVGKSIIG